MNPEEREALFKVLKIITAEQNELLKKILAELEKISANTEYLAQTYVAPS